MKFKKNRTSAILFIDLLISETSLDITVYYIRDHFQLWRDKSTDTFVLNKTLYWLYNVYSSNILFLFFMSEEVTENKSKCSTNR